MQNPALAKTLMIVGILIVLIAGFADPLGLGRSPGFGWRQVAWNHHVHQLPGVRPPDGLRTQSARRLPSFGSLRSENPEWCPGGGPPRSTPGEVRTGHQPQDRQGARADDSSLSAGASGSGDRVTRTWPGDTDNEPN